MKFSIIIPTYNDWSRLLKCLNAVQHQTLDGDDYEIIVVDNNPDGNAPPELILNNRITIVQEAKPGSYAARNKGAQIATGDIFAFTDSDCIPDKDWLKNAAKKFSDLSVDLVGGKVEIFQSEQSNKYGYLYERVTAFPQHIHVPNGKGVTANLFVRSSVFWSVGGFNAEIKSGGDWDFTLRCTEMGYRMIYEENVVVQHPARNLLTIFKKQYRLACGGAVQIKEKYGHGNMRILGSHVLNGMPYKREYGSKNISWREKTIIFLIDLGTYIYRTLIFSGLVVRIINPRKVRE